MSHIVVLHHDPIQLHLLGLLLKQDHEVVNCCMNWDEVDYVLQDSISVDGMVVDLHLICRHRMKKGSLLGYPIDDWFHPIPALGLTLYSCEPEMIQPSDVFSIQACLSLPVDPQHFRHCVHKLIQECTEYSVLQV